LSNTEVEVDAHCDGFIFDGTFNVTKVIKGLTTRPTKPKPIDRNDGKTKVSSV
jgi:hypothetical protein